MDGWMDGWVDGWMDGWIGGLHIYWLVTRVRSVSLLCTHSMPYAPTIIAVFILFMCLCATVDVGRSVRAGEVGRSVRAGEVGLVSVLVRWIE